MRQDENKLNATSFLYHQVGLDYYYLHMLERFGDKEVECELRNCARQESLEGGEGKAITANKQKVQSERPERTKRGERTETPGHLSHPFEKVYCRQ